MNLKSNLSKEQIFKKRVFLRADLNLPLVNGQIINDFRFQCLKPTLDFLVAKKASIILATHIDRPKNSDPHFSTKLLLPLFVSAGYKIEHEPNLKLAYIKSQKLEHGKILLLENLRFYEGEESTDFNLRINFAQNLAKFADYYINDAFGILHRQDTSITLLSQLFDNDKRSIGFLIEKELKELNKLKEKKPFLLILGGGKIKSKIPCISNIINNITKPSTILLCPAISFTFLKALGKKTGNSLVEIDFLNLALKILQKAKEKNTNILMPTDYYYLDMEKNIKYSDNDSIPDNCVGLSFGPKTMAQYLLIINKAKSIFLNGPMGFEEKPETMEPFRILLQTIAHSTAFSVVGGGESVAAVYRYELVDNISFCSSGGGSSLAYLSGETLPGLQAFI